MIFDVRSLNSKKKARSLVLHRGFFIFGRMGLLEISDIWNTHFSFITETIKLTR